MLFFISFYSIFILIILIGQLSLKENFSEDDIIDLEDVTVIIPFRNEEDNLRNLFDSLNTQTCLPKIILINDHSDDDSCRIVEEYTFLSVKLIHLEEDYGKKAAIRLGIKNADTDYILTIDADTMLPSSYFSELKRLQKHDAVILPVKIKNQPFAGFFNLDYYYLFALNAGLHFLKRPFSASGANLLFRKDIYQQFAEQDKYHNVSSGDDTYLLNYLVQNNKDIQINLNSSLAVKTEIPNKFTDILHQRIRWIKKSSSVQNYLAFLLGILGLIYHLGFYALIYFNQDYLFELILLKASFELILFIPYLNKIGDRISFVKIALFSIFYPFWIVIVMLSAILIQPRWKGRKTNLKVSLKN